MRLSILILLFLTGLFNSCDQRSCENVNCPAGRTCINGNCVCPSGFEGANCDQDATRKFIGNYQASENCLSGAPLVGTYFPFVSVNPNRPSEIIINNFLAQFTIYAQIQTDNNNLGTIVVIPNQNLGGSSGSFVTGQGNFDVANNRMTLNLEYYINFENKACTHTFFKQP